MPRYTVNLPHRVYVPTPNEYGESTPDALVVHCECCHYCSVGDNLTIFVDGACPGNGTPKARAGMGVYFYEDCPMNISTPLLEGPFTNQRAELCPAIAALETVQDLIIQDALGIPFKGVVLVSDSAYLVNAVTDWITKWSRNGWKNSEGRPVANMDDILKLDGLVGWLEANHLPVRFWRVDRSQNTYADILAKQAVAL
ncbi:hypothetical protein D9756_006614 [Leucocoprinus leucothites]|uniref:ribonuclease H n=1 Tax=Leucocoprinus leucothites TaxID=201217 RepID=A0A8H5G237_9AGAR|nr:hypothetical protein D9756_006614 [Leucoagaricus leucothites]